MIVCNRFCGNCRVVWMEEDDPSDLCPACSYLKNCGRFRPRMWGDNEGLVNRRWQMRFNCGQLAEHKEPTSPLWERKQREQDW